MEAPNNMRATGLPEDRVVVKNIGKVIGLTHAGEQCLSFFNDKALGYALQEYSKTKGVRDPFLWFFSVAKRYYQEHGLSLNWQEYGDLKRKYGIGPDTLLLTERPPVTVHAPKEYQPSVKRYTALDIANGITRFMNEEALANMVKLIGTEAATEFRDQQLRKWVALEYTSDDSPQSQSAVLYITRTRERLNKNEDQL